MIGAQRQSESLDGQSLSDKEIQRRVLAELDWDSEVKTSSVGVSVDSGVVTLTGTVGSYSEKMAAQRAAHRVVGARDVANDLIVKPGSRSITDDARIAHAVRQALEWDRRVPHERIHSTVSNGFVTLEGEVERYIERSRAAEVVRNLVSVLGVNNFIQVKPAKVNTIDVRHAIELALERQVDVHCKDIQIETRDGIVTLRGTVRSWPEREAIYESVSHAPGVRSVESHLRVNPYI